MTDDNHECSSCIHRVVCKDCEYIPFVGVNGCYIKDGYDCHRKCLHYIEQPENMTECHECIYGLTEGKYIWCKRENGGYYDDDGCAEKTLRYRAYSCPHGKKRKIQDR